MYTRTLRLHLALILCTALGGSARSASAQALPIAHPAVQAFDSVVGADTARDDESGKDTKVHGRKVVRPGGEIRPVFVWRGSAALATALALGGALLLALPVAGVYEFTSRKRTTLDRGLTQSILLLPPIVAGIVMVVQGSLALAFSLAGVATTVRFRSQLKDTNDAVYIFLALSIGIAAGAQALDIAAVVSVGSCVAALIVWRITGSIHHPPIVLPNEWDENGGTAPSSAASPAAGTPAAGTPAAGPPAAAAVSPLGHEDGRDATVIVWAPHDDHARDTVESLLDGLTKQWRLEVIDEEPNGDARLRYVVRSKKRLDPDALVAAITAAGSGQGIRAELARPAEGATVSKTAEKADKTHKTEKPDKPDEHGGAAAGAGTPVPAT